VTEPAEDSREPRAPRSAGIWLVLLIVWLLGLIAWMFYIGLGVTILYRIL
jgi:hypothetical protein